MKIRAIEVIRDKGFWTHPDLPIEEWGERLTREEFEAFEEKNNFKVSFVEMDDDAPLEFVNQWFDEGLDDCSPWKPTPPSEEAFLLSIHDTEDGPVAWFARPLNYSPIQGA
jgi:hypothetical protein